MGIIIESGQESVRVLDQNDLFLIFLLSGLTIFLLQLLGISAGAWSIAAFPIYAIALNYIKYGDINRAYALLKRADGHEKALELCNKLIAKRPGDWRIYYARAYALWYSNRRFEALSDCEFILAMDSENLSARLGRAALYAELAEWDKSLEETEELISKLKQSVARYKQIFVNALNIRASVFFHQGKFGEAVETRAIAIDSRNHTARIGMANCRREQGMYEKALHELDMIKNPSERERAYCLSNRARILLQQDRAAEGLEQSRLALNILGQDAAILSTYGRALFTNNLYSDAEGVLNKAIELHPTRGETYWFRHQLHKRQGQNEKADLDEKIARSFGYRPFAECLDQSQPTDRALPTEFDS